MNRLMRILIVLALCLGAAAAAFAAEFSADVVQTMGGQQMPGGKAYVKDNKIRMERSMAGHSQVTIMDASEAKVVMLQPEAKTYMEIRQDPAKMGAAALKEDKNDYGQWRAVGTETVDGWDCEKRVFDYKDKSLGELTAWFAVKLGYPIKTVHKGEMGLMTMEYKNIKAGNVDPALFTVPAGYQKMAMPAMGGMMPGKKPGM